METIGERLAEVRRHIDAAAHRVRRDPADVHLVAVSKTHPASAIREAYAAGQRDFGESYAQELRDKRRELADLPDIRWHFIGRIQSNKAKYILPCDRVHALDSVHHAQALAERGPVTALLAVNVASEDSKSGAAEAEALDVAAAIDAIEGVRLVGLMTLPPADEDPAPYFARLAALARLGRERGLDLGELSMGMSGDYEDAIAHGATWIRVGTAIFGPRET